MKLSTLRKVALSFSLLLMVSVYGQTKVMVMNDQATLTIEKSEVFIPVEKESHLQEIIHVEGDFIYLRFNITTEGGFYSSTSQGHAYYQRIEKRRLSTGELIYQAQTQNTDIDNEVGQFEDCTFLEGSVYLTYTTFDASDDSIHIYSRRIDISGNLGSWTKLASAFSKDQEGGGHQFHWDKRRKQLQILSISGDSEEDQTHLSYQIYNQDLKLVTSLKSTYPIELDKYVWIASGFNNGKAYFIHYYEDEDNDNQPLSTFNEWLPSSGEIVSFPYYVTTFPHKVWISFRNEKPYVYGLAEEDEEDYFSGVFVQAIDVQAKTITVLSDTTFEDDFLDDFEDYDSYTLRRQHPNYRRICEFVYSDGTTAAVVQRRFSIHTIGSSIDDYRHYAEDYFIMKFNSNHSLEWYQHVPLRLDFETRAFLNILTSFDGESINLFFPNHPKNSEYWMDGRQKAKLKTNDASTLATINRAGEVSYADTDQEYNLEELQCFVSGVESLTYPMNGSMDEFIVIVATEEKQLHFGTAKFTDSVAPVDEEQDN